MAGSASVASLVGGPEFSRAAQCVLTSRQVDGPYHITDAEERRDVRSGKPGTDLVLRLKIIDADSCAAIAGARTEIWSCDALGNYSGHPDVDPNVPPGLGGGGVRVGQRRSAGRAAANSGGGRGGHRDPTGPQRFLRGFQVANDGGEVRFLTIYPGWYSPRAVHVHVKVHLDEQELLTTQLYFPDELTDSIHRTEPYAARYPTPFRNANDRVMHWRLDGTGPVGVYPAMTAEGTSQVGTLTIGVRRG